MANERGWNLWLLLHAVVAALLWMATVETSGTVSVVFYALAALVVVANARLMYRLVWRSRRLSDRDLRRLSKAAPEAVAELTLLADATDVASMARREAIKRELGDQRARNLLW